MGNQTNDKGSVAFTAWIALAAVKFEVDQYDLFELAQQQVKCAHAPRSL
jgi:hypothetical protein